MADTDLDTERVWDAALALPTREAVETIATQAANVAINEARQIAFAQIGKLPETINKRFDAIRDEWFKLVPKLGSIDTAEAAIEAGKVKEWQQFADLRTRYANLRSLVTLARKHGVLPEPKPGVGAAALFRLDANPHHVPAHTDKLRRFAFEQARRPWTPTSAAAADLVVEAWARGEQVAP
ncbi:hypothetical protein EEB19_05085 [Gordonia sp. OPL2]|nr:hypothetical protein EEB19_05085 [Gordonia sp. OPL2]